MKNLLQPHEWHYLQHTAINKTDAVCWRHGYMIEPDERTLFVNGPPDHEFLINPVKEDITRYELGNGQIDVDKEYQWGPGLEEESKDNDPFELIETFL